MAGGSHNVVGFHGTTLDDAERIVSGPLRDSSSEARWLGRGIYFFERNSELAIRWARLRAAKQGKDAALIRAEIDLSTCFDLTRPTYQLIARSAHALLQARWSADPSIVPADQKPFELLSGQVRAGFRGDWQDYGRNELDFAVVEEAIQLAKDKHNITLDTVRGAFIEDAPLYTHSWFYEGAHVAIAVRPPFNRITSLKLIEIE